MSRYFLSEPARQDLLEIGHYLRSLPKQPALRIAGQLQAMMRTIAAFPKQGRVHQEFSQAVGEDVRVRVAEDYLLYYMDRAVPEVIAVLHGRRDVEGIVRARLE